jgi:hypothetical protein
MVSRCSRERPSRKVNAVGYHIPQRLPADLKRLAILKGRDTDYLGILGASHESGDIQRDL